MLSLFQLNRLPPNFKAQFFIVCTKSAIVRPPVPHFRRFVFVAVGYEKHDCTGYAARADATH